MAPLEEVVRVSFVQGPRNEEDNVVDHVGVPVAVGACTRMGAKSVSSSPWASFLSRRFSGQSNARHVVEKLFQVSGGVGPDIVELVDHSLGGAFGNGRSRDGRGLVGEKVAIVGRGQLHLEIVERLALGQVRVLGLGEEAGFEASEDAFEVARVRVEEEGFGHNAGGCCTMVESVSQPEKTRLYERRLQIVRQEEERESTTLTPAVGLGGDPGGRGSICTLGRRVDLRCSRSRMQERECVGRQRREDETDE